MPNTKAVSLADFDTQLQHCPICRGLTFETLAKQDRNLLGVVTVGCMACGLVQTNPRPSPAGLDIFYRDHYRLFYQGIDSPDSNYISSLNKDIRLSQTARFFSEDLNISHSAVVLDFGCGEGSLFAALRKAGFNAAFYGVELNASFGEFASRYGEATVSNRIHTPVPVDLVILNHVLEHLANPIDILKSLGKLLNSDGRLYIDVPDVEEYSGIQDLHLAHIYHFTVRTLQQLVEQAGYAVLRVEKHSPPFHPHSVRLVAELAPSGATSLHYPSIESEQLAWSAAKNSGRWRKSVRLRFAQIEFLRKAYKAGRRLLGRITK